MMRKTKTRTIAIATAITTLLSATSVLADTKGSNIVQAPKFSQTQSYEAHGWFKNRLESLVNSGTPTQAQEDAIQSTVPKADSAKGKFNKGHHYGELKTVLDGLVKAGTINQAQADAIRSAITTAKEATPTKGAGAAKGEFKRGDSEFKTVLDGRVKTGTINQAHEDALQGYSD